jgi:peptidoglycan/LPS O-acetylase OafA/YrhL
VSQPSSAGHDRLPGLDGLRAFAVLLVLLTHYCRDDATGTWFDHVIRGGGFGVSIFFVLSGFLITFLLIREEDTTGRISMPLFYARRCLRILPPLVFYLAVVSVLSFVGTIAVPVGDIFAGLFFVRNYYGSSFETAQLWSLAIEEQFYLVWPLLVVMIRSRRARLALCLALLLLSPIWRQTCIRLAGGAERLNWWRGDLRLDFLMAGCLLAITITTPRGRRLLASPWIANDLIAFLAAAALFVLELSGIRFPRLVLFATPTLSSISVAILVNCAIHKPRSPLGLILNCPPLAWLGRLSYSLYLWQQLFAPIEGATGSPWFRTFPVNLVLACGTSIFSYYVVEQPLFSLRKHLRPTMQSKKTPSGS